MSTREWPEMRSPSTSTPPHLLVSTTGTSLLTNGASDETRRLLSRTANLSEKDLPAADRKALDQRIQEQRQRLSQAEQAEAIRLSAELNGLLAFYRGQFSPAAKRNRHVLLHTDTYQGEQVAKMIQEWLQNQEGQAETRTFAGLSTRSVADFHLATSEIVSWAAGELPGYRGSGWRVVFNLTGGFKSVNGFLQAVGMFHADEVVYLFESSSELIRIPRLPINLDTKGVVMANLDTFRRLAVFGQAPLADCSALPETMLLINDDKAGLSTWGELSWAEAKPEIYQSDLLTPVSEQIASSETFRRSVKALSPERVSQINQTLDDLARHLQTERPMPTSSKFKKLAGNPVPGSTHEIYAWTDGDARRIFGHYEGRVFHLDTLGKHL